MGKLLAALAARLMLIGLAYFGALMGLVLVFSPTGGWPAPCAAAITFALFIAWEEIDY